MLPGKQDILLRPTLVQEMLAAKPVVVGGEAFLPPLGDARAFGFLDVSRKVGHNCTHDLVLNAENVLDIAVITLRPQMTTRRRFQKLHGDAYVIADPSHAAFHDIAGA